ncbi:MAG: hypothetical protein J07HX5_01039 [halophilic archaeon J07HX5]|nr:MAG: hypothetical protein J07HX5_01039 [halophilic archaeon J07HX5]
MRVADVTDATLLFASSQGGHLHTPCEWTDWEDCVQTTTVLARALAAAATA